MYLKEHIPKNQKQVMKNAHGMIKYTHREFKRAPCFTQNVHHQYNNTICESYNKKHSPGNKK